jgi:hypothetical protein
VKTTKIWEDTAATLVFIANKKNPQLALWLKIQKVPTITCLTVRYEPILILSFIFFL